MDIINHKSAVVFCEVSIYFWYVKYVGLWVYMWVYMWVVVVVVVVVVDVKFRIELKIVARLACWKLGHRGAGIHKFVGLFAFLA